ncbi:hypothetical protein EST38_g5263 [Candolleomyces aberdarensis]|uniref:Uncharacterized protein n=1 Tax=Candolleomyces aberdarensis TaxID=2316362 RepID=A0A4Q2DKW4_9AGAR|nr:hypothetical protein EST38_g5263 [Candolleomyces aberdarensis]
MYGQTNCFLGTGINKGEEPFAVNHEVYVLPMDNVMATKYVVYIYECATSLLIVPEGTGVVTSVPSDPPSDHETLMDPHKKPEFYKIDPPYAAIGPIPVPAISVPTCGDMTAPAIVKIQSQKYTKQLAEAKEIAYKPGFVRDRMIKADWRFRMQNLKILSSRVARMNVLLRSWISSVWIMASLSGRSKIKGASFILIYFDEEPCVLINGLFDSMQVARQD